MAVLDDDIRCVKFLAADDYLSKPLEAEKFLLVVQGKLLTAEQLQELFSHAY